MSSQFLIQIFERARTFQITHWRYQDQSVFDPYMLASIGYKVTKKNTIQCEICHHSVKFLEEDDENPSKNQGQILNHKENCIYLNEKAKNISKEELYLRMDEIMTNIQQENKKIEAKLYPILKTKSIWQFVGLDKYTLNKILQSYGIDKKEYKISFMLQIFGWYSSLEEGKQHLKCYFCGRRVEKEQYLTVSSDKQDTTKENEERAFDPIAEHRYYCIWVSKSVNGWLINLQNLYDKLNELIGYKLKSNPNETKKMRVQIDRYIEVFQVKTFEQFSKMNNIFNECERLSNVISEDLNLKSEKKSAQFEEQGNKLKHRRQQASELLQQLHQFSSQGLKRIKID